MVKERGGSKRMPLFFLENRLFFFFDFFGCVENLFYLCPEI